MQKDSGHAKCVGLLISAIVMCIDCTNFIDFKLTYGHTREDGRKELHFDWHTWPELDALNLNVANLAKTMTKGMTVDVLCASY